MIKLLGLIILLATVFWPAPAPMADAPLVESAVPECRLAEAWVEANRDALPTTLEAFGEYSVPFRRAIYRALDVEARISLWREHLDGAADELTSHRQRLFLERVTRELDGHLRGALPQTELDALAEEATAILGKDLAYRTIAMLGPVATPVAEGGVQSGEAPICKCHSNHPFMCWRPWSPNDVCLFGGCPPTPDGCSWLWEYSCDGRCTTIRDE